MLYQCTLGRWARGAMSGAPALFRALREELKTEGFAMELSAEQHEPTTTPEAVFEHAAWI